jgi:arylsulfatase A-like enzyme
MKIFLHTALILSVSGLHAEKPNIIVIFADDLGYADLGCQGQNKDVITPHLDEFAKEGVRFTAGYISAPQCSPSRVGLLTGRYQQRVGIDTIPDIPMPIAELTIADMLKPAGYFSGQVGKWHLEPNALCVNWAKKNRPAIKPDEKGRINVPIKDQIAYSPGYQGFDEYFTGEMKRYYSNYTLEGKECAAGFQTISGPRVDIQTDAALTFIRRNQEKPFFLYLAYFAPHTPLELTKPYVDKFSSELPLRRRAALSLIANVDKGVARILAQLKELNLDENTLIFFTSDNGAPLHNLEDSPLNTDEGGWDGSLNTPWLGEKGMLSEGGIRVPFLVRWPGKIPGGRVIDTPVSTLDIAATALAAAEAKSASKLDGVNLLPVLKDPSVTLAPRVLHWRFWNQIACRDAQWKYLSVRNQKEFLFDLSSKDHENVNLAEKHPEILNKLRAASHAWAAELKPAGVPDGGGYPQEKSWYREYFKLEIK